MNKEKLPHTTSSAEAADQGEVVSVRELVNVIVEKDRLLKDLLERLMSTTATTSLAAVESQGVTTFQVIPDLSKNISNLAAVRARHELVNGWRTCSERWRFINGRHHFSSRAPIPTSREPPRIGYAHAALTSPGGKSSRTVFAEPLSVRRVQRNAEEGCRMASNNGAKVQRPTFTLRFVCARRQDLTSAIHGSKVSRACVQDN